MKTSTLTVQDKKSVAVAYIGYVEFSKAVCLQCVAQKQFFKMLDICWFWLLY